MLLAYALVLLLLQRLQQLAFPASTDVIGLGLGRAALNFLPLLQLNVGWAGV